MKAELRLDLFNLLPIKPMKTEPKFLQRDKLTTASTVPLRNNGQLFTSSPRRILCTRVRMAVCMRTYVDRTRGNDVIRDFDR